MTTDMDNPKASENTDLSTHMSARMSARPRRIEVITRGERRRRWSAVEKQAIVAESLEPNASIAGIARRHGIGTGQLYGWRHQFLANRPGKAASFARVELLSEPYRLGRSPWPYFAPGCVRGACCPGTLAACCGSAATGGGK